MVFFRVVEGEFSFHVQKSSVIDIRSVPVSCGFIWREYGRDREVSFSKDAFNARIRRRPIGKLQPPLAMDVSSIGIIFSEAQLARPLRVGAESLA